MINFNSSESNEAWQRYLLEKDSYEEALRKSNRDFAIQAYEEEKKQAEEELKFNRAIYDFKQKKIKDFWNNTYQELGREILYAKTADFSEEVLIEFSNSIQEKQRKLILECCILDSKIKDSVELTQTEFFERPEEAKYDFVAKTAHTVQMIDFLKYKRAVEGPRVIQKTEENQMLQPRSTAEKPANTLKYVSRKEKVERLMAKSPIFAQPTNSTNEMDRIPVKSPFQQRVDIPEEVGQKIGQEQPFVSDFIVDSGRGDVPQRITVRMEPLSPKDQLREQFSVSKTRQLAAHSNVHNDPYFEEKNFVKKNFDLYKRGSDQLSPQKTGAYDTAEETNKTGLAAPNIFDLSKGALEGVEELEESFIARLNEKFRNAYIEANSRKFLPKKNRLQISASGASLVQEIPFVHDDTLRESHLISSLLTPHASDFAHISQRTGPLSNSKDLRGRGRGDQADQYDLSLSESPQKGSSRKYQGDRRGRREDAEEAKRRGGSPSKRAIQMIPIFDSFEYDFFRNRKQLLEEAERDQLNEANEQGQLELDKAYGPRRSSEQKKPMINHAEAEDFILELTRLVTQGYGVIPSRCQSKLSELVSSSQVAKQDRNVKSKVAESLGQKASPKRSKPILIDKNTIGLEEAGPQNIDDFNAISVHLDQISNGLSARYLEFLRSRISLDSVRTGWTALLALLADYDKLVPLKSGKLNINDETLTAYLGQPGRVKLQLQKLPSLLTQNPISQHFLNEFYVAFDHFTQCVSRAGEPGELIPFFRYLYFIRRFIDVARAFDLIKIKNEEKTTPVTKKKNEEYLLNAQRRREEREGSVHREHVREEAEVYGINFAEWAQNLDEIERENRIIKSNLNAEKVKEENEEKRLRKIEEKKQAALDLEYDRKQLEKEQEREKENREQEKRFKHELNVREAQNKKVLREQQNEQRKQFEREEIEQTLVNSELKAQRIVEQKERVHREIHERNERIKEKKEVIAHNHRVEKELQKEERAWERAQKLLLRQQLLLQEREQLSNSAKASYK